MTESETHTATTPRPRSRPRPAPRTRAQAATVSVGEAEPAAWARQLLESNQRLSQRLDALEEREQPALPPVEPVVEASPPRPQLPNGTPDRLAEAERSLDEQLALRAAPPDDPGAGPSGLTYNFPLMWYRRPDGDIVQLQSDPNNREYYVEKLGFVYLRPAEVKQWLDVVRPRRIAEQREKAAIITALRRWASGKPGYTLEYDDPSRGSTDAEKFSDMSLERLREVHREIEQDEGVKIRLPRFKSEPPAATATDPRLSGVETDASMTMEGFQQKLQRANGKRLPRRDGIELHPGRPRTFASN